MPSALSGTQVIPLILPLRQIPKPSIILGRYQQIEGVELPFGEIIVPDEVRRDAPFLKFPVQHGEVLRRVPLLGRGGLVGVVIRLDLYDLDDRVEALVLERPEALNVGAFALQGLELLAEVDLDEEVRIEAGPHPRLAPAEVFVINAVKAHVPRLDPRLQVSGMLDEP